MLAFRMGRLPMAAPQRGHAEALLPAFHSQLLQEAVVAADEGGSTVQESVSDHLLAGVTRAGTMGRAVHVKLAGPLVGRSVEMAQLVSPFSPWLAGALGACRCCC